MKRNDINQLNNDSLAKYLSGEMSEVELRDFENEIAVSEENKNSIEKMKKQWSAIKGYREPKTPDTNTSKAWNKLHERLDNENLLPAKAAEIRNRFIPVLARVAAVILVLVGISTVIYLQFNRNSAVEMVQINTLNEANTLIKTLDDGSVIYIAQNSLFSFPKEFENDSRNAELKGEAFFDIVPNPDKPFIIETDDVLIEVLGTAFNVRTEDVEGFELFVDRGKVKVTLKKDPSHSELVVAGEKVTTNKNNIVKSKFVADQTSLWYKQHMHFKDESLQNIISVLNRNFNTTFVITEKEIENRRLTVTFNNETAEKMTELLCVAENLKSQNINGSVVLSENKENAKTN